MLERLSGATASSCWANQVAENGLSVMGGGADWKAVQSRSLLLLFVSLVRVESVSKSKLNESITKEGKTRNAWNEWSKSDFIHDVFLVYTTSSGDRPFSFTCDTHTMKAMLLLQLACVCIWTVFFPSLVKSSSHGGQWTRLVFSLIRGRYRGTSRSAWPTPLTKKSGRASRKNDAMFSAESPSSLSLAPELIEVTQVTVDSSCVTSRALDTNNTQWALCVWTCSDDSSEQSGVISVFHSNQKSVIDASGRNVFFSLIEIERKKWICWINIDRAFPCRTARLLICRSLDQQCLNGAFFFFSVVVFISSLSSLICARTRKESIALGRKWIRKCAKREREHGSQLLLFLLGYRKKTKLSSVNRLPSLYGQTLLKSEYDYQREIRRKLDQLQHDNRETVRRRLANNYLFAHEHLTKRHQWFHNDKSYRDSCRVLWNRESAEKARTSHLHLPSIFVNDSTETIQPITPDENPMITDAKIKQNFLRTQPVMLEVLNAPHSSQVLRQKREMELRKKSAQQRFRNIQNNAMDDQRYRRLVVSLQEV